MRGTNERRRLIRVPRKRSVVVVTALVVTGCVLATGPALGVGTQARACLTATERAAAAADLRCDAGLRHLTEQVFQELLTAELHG